MLKDITDPKAPACCRPGENRTLVEEKEQETGTMFVEQCKTCDRNHYRFKPGPIHLGADIQPLAG